MLLKQLTNSFYVTFYSFPFIYSISCLEAHNCKFENEITFSIKQSISPLKTLKMYYFYDVPLMSVRVERVREKFSHY